MGNSSSRVEREKNSNDFLHLSQIQVSALELPTTITHHHEHATSSLGSSSYASSSTGTSSTGGSDNSAGSSDVSSQSTDYSDDVDLRPPSHTDGRDALSGSSAYLDLSRALPSAMGRLTPAQRAAIMARRELPEAETSVDLIEEMEIARLHNLTHVALMVLQALLTLVFLAMILRKLDGIQGTLPWIIVFSPLYVSNFMRVVARLFELSRLLVLIARFRSNALVPQYHFVCFTIPFPMVPVLMPTLLDFVDNLGEMVTAVLLAMYLDESELLISRSIFVLFTPLWIQTFLGALLRCWRCSPEEGDPLDPGAPFSRRAKRLGAALKATGYLSYKAAPAIMIALRIDGVISVSWAVVFSPWFIVLALLATASCCFCGLMNSRGPLQPHEGVDPEGREHFAESWSCLVRGMALYILAMDALALLFLYRLATLLDHSSRRISFASLLAPLFVLYGCTLLFSPPLFLANARIDEYRRSTELAQRQASEEVLLEQGERDERRARRAEKRARRARPTIKPASRNVFLLRQSATVFRRAKNASESTEEKNVLPSSSPVHNRSSDWRDRDEKEEGDAKPCYICMSSQANGVLMECGHGGLCYACGLELARKGQTCPLCRAIIMEVVQIESTSLSFGVARSLVQTEVLQRDSRRQKTRRGTTM